MMNHIHIKRLNPVLFFACLIALAVFQSCSGDSTISGGKQERTLPGAFNFPDTTITSVLNHEVSVPDSVNIDGFAVHITYCPPGQECYEGSAINIGSSPTIQDADSTIHIYIQESRQFQEGGHYRFSLGISDKRTVKLLGYSPLAASK